MCARPPAVARRAVACCVGVLLALIQALGVYDSRPCCARRAGRLRSGRQYFVLRVATKQKKSRAQAIASNRLRNQERWWHARCVECLWSLCVDLLCCVGCERGQDSTALSAEQRALCRCLCTREDGSEGKGERERLQSLELEGECLLLCMRLDGSGRKARLIYGWHG